LPKEYPRSARINSQIQRQLTDLIRDELRDPRVAGATLTSVQVSPDMRHAKIFVSVLSLDRTADDAAKALNGASGKLRHALKHQMSTKHIPELHFHADHVPEAAAHIDKVIRDARGEDQKHAAERGEKDS
jgi:ribosome-binding factor A